MLIHEAVAAIEQSGGTVHQPCIFFPDNVTPSEDARKAIEFLTSQWSFRIEYVNDIDDDEHDEIAP